MKTENSRRDFFTYRRYLFDYMFDLFNSNLMFNQVRENNLEVYSLNPGGESELLIMEKIWFKIDNIPTCIMLEHHYGYKIRVVFDSRLLRKYDRKIPKHSAFAIDLPDKRSKIIKGYRSTIKIVNNYTNGSKFKFTGKIINLSSRHVAVNRLIDVIRLFYSKRCVSESRTQDFLESSSSEDVFGSSERVNS